MDRREFLEKSALAGGLIFLGSKLIGCVDNPNPVAPPGDGTDDPSNGNSGRLPRIGIHDIQNSWVGERYGSIVGASGAKEYKLVSSTIEDLRHLSPDRGNIITSYALRPDQVGPYKIAVDVSNDAGTVQAVLDGNENPVYSIDRYLHEFSWGIKDPDVGDTAVGNKSREFLFAKLMGIPADEVQNIPIKELDRGDRIYQRGYAPEYKTIMENLRKLNDEELFLAFNSRSLIVEHNVVRELDKIKEWLEKDSIYYFGHRAKDLWNGGTVQAPAKYGLENAVNDNYQRNHPVRLFIDMLGNMRR